MCKDQSARSTVMKMVSGVCVCAGVGGGGGGGGGLCFGRGCNPSSSPL